MNLTFSVEESTDISMIAEEVVPPQPVESTRSMWIAFWSNLLFAVIEFAGGMLTNSVTILSDAMHDFGDSLVIGLSLLLEKKSLKGRTNKYTYGQRRFSILAAFFTSLVLIIGSVFIIVAAVQRFIHIESVQTGGVIGLAVLGILCNGFSAVRLMKDSKQSLNHRSIMLHLLEDVLGWVAVLVGAIIMHYTHWYWIDPLLSLIIAAIILWNASRNMFSSIQIFLQAKPENLDEVLLAEEVKALPGVCHIAGMHCWTLDGTEHVVTMKIDCSASLEKNEISALRSRVDSLLQQHGIAHVTIEIR